MIVLPTFCSKRSRLCSFLFGWCKSPSVQWNPLSHQTASALWLMLTAAVVSKHFPRRWSDSPNHAQDNVIVPQNRCSRRWKCKWLDCAATQKNTAFLHHLLYYLWQSSTVYIRHLIRHGWKGSHRGSLTCHWQIKLRFILWVMPSWSQRDGYRLLYICDILCV